MADRLKEVQDLLKEIQSETEIISGPSAKINDEKLTFVVDRNAFIIASVLVSVAITLTCLIGCAALSNSPERYYYEAPKYKV